MKHDDFSKITEALESIEKDLKASLAKINVTYTPYAMAAYYGVPNRCASKIGFLLMKIFIRVL